MTRQEATLTLTKILTDKFNEMLNSDELGPVNSAFDKELSDNVGLHMANAAIAVYLAQMEVSNAQDSVGIENFVGKE